MSIANRSPRPSTVFSLRNENAICHSEITIRQSIPKSNRAVGGVASPNRTSTEADGLIRGPIDDSLKQGAAIAPALNAQPD